MYEMVDGGWRERREKTNKKEVAKHIQAVGAVAASPHHLERHGR
jgi:hypothetical protein